MPEFHTEKEILQLPPVRGIRDLAATQSSPTENPTQSSPTENPTVLSLEATHHSVSSRSITQFIPFFNCDSLLMERSRNLHFPRAHRKAKNSRIAICTLEKSDYIKDFKKKICGLENTGASLLFSSQQHGKQHVSNTIFQV